MPTSSVGNIFHLIIRVIRAIRVRLISSAFSYLFLVKTMIVTNNLTVKNQPTKSVSTTERVMASTMSVDEYFDELISQVHKDYADL